MYDRGIEAFLAVADTHSISGAAALLHITQSAVSHRLRELEKQLEVVLINRQKGIRRSDLTLAGEKFYPLAEKWSRLWQETRHIQSAVSTLSVKIGCVDSVNTLILPEFYRKLVSNDPPIHLRIFTMRSVELYEKIEKKELDIAFVLHRQRFKHMNVVPFYREPMQVVRPREDRINSGRINPTALKPENELYVNWGRSYQIWHDQTWDPLNQPKIELDSVFLLQALLNAPDTWAIVPQSVARHLTGKAKISIQRLSPPAPDRIAYMVTHRYPRMGARAPIEIIQATAEGLGFLHTTEEK